MFTFYLSVISAQKFELWSGNTSFFQCLSYPINYRTYIEEVFFPLKN